MEDKEICLFRDHILKGQYDKLFAKEGGEKKDSMMSKQAKMQKVGGGRDRRQKYNMSIFEAVTHKISNKQKQLLLYYIYEQQYRELMS